MLWNCNNHGLNDRGMLSCDVELRSGGKVVYSLPNVATAWVKNEEPATTIRLPKVAFDTLRIQTAAYQSMGPALCEIEVFQGDTNLARAKPAIASDSHHSGLPAAGVVDGVKNSAEDHRGYWAANNHQAAWVEVQVAPPTAKSANGQ